MNVNNIIETVQALGLEDAEFEQQVEDVSSTIKLIFLESKENEDELSKLVEKHLTPSTLEKKKNAEVSTPDKLCKEMLEPLAKEIKELFKESQGKINRPFKVLEPCCGKGIFLLNIYKFLKDNSTLTKKQILEECIYFADISPLNIFICRLLLDPKEEYALNYQTGDSLKITWNDVPGGFDAVVGNPPYNASGSTSTGNTIWQHFVRNSLNNWICLGGYLSFVHPPGWRKPESTNAKEKTFGMFELMTRKNTMISLTIRGLIAGKQMFNCGTRYDHYLIKKIPNKDFCTKVNDEKYLEQLINLSIWEWLPNHSITLISKIIARNGNSLDVLYSRSSYGSDKKHVSYEKSDIFKYPLIHSTPKSGIRYCYSSINDKGMFGVSKVIFGDSGINEVIIDINGKYGMTEHSIALVVDFKDEGIAIHKCLLSMQFNNILNACSWSNYQIQWRVFTYLKKDFYKYLEE